MGVGRIKSFVFGCTVGGGSYLFMHRYLTANLSRINSGLNSVRHEINPDAPQQKTLKPSNAAFAGTTLGQYREEAAKSFRKNWNDALRSTYTGVTTLLRNPDFPLSKPTEVPQNSEKSS